MVRRLVVLVVVLAGLAGCGRGNVLESDSTAPFGAPTATIPPLPSVVEVRLGDDERHLVATVVDAPAGDDPACALNEAGFADESVPGTIRLNPVALTSPGSFLAGCPTAETEIEVALDADVGGRRIVTSGVLGEEVTFVVRGGTVDRCALPDCDPATGEAPIPATCDDGTLVDDLRTADVPMHAGITETRCEGEWAVVGVDVASGSCPPTDDGTAKPCASGISTWYFLQAVGPQWQVITFGPVDGCEMVHTVEPAFPEALCADLVSAP